MSVRGIRSAALAAGLVLCCFLPPENAPAAPAPQPQLRVVYGFDREYPPFSFQEAGGKATGFEAELVEAVFAGHAKPVPRPLQWDMVPVELSAGTINLTSGMVRTEQRSKIYAFSDKPTFLLPIYLFTKTYNRFPNAGFLRGQRVSVEEGSYQHRLLQDFGGMNIKPYKGKVAPLRALYNDEVDAYCGPLPTADFYMKKMNYTGISTLGTPLGIVEMRLAVNRERGDILKIVNEGLAAVRKSGEYDRIYRKWFVTEPTKEQQDALVKAARDATLTAYAPYTKKGMGAAVLTGTGAVYSGGTVENADPRFHISAVSAALARSVAAGEVELRAVVLVNEKGAVVRPSSDDCQVMYEFGRGILALVETAPGKRELPMLAELLPVPVVAPTPALKIE